MCISQQNHRSWVLTGKMPDPTTLVPLKVDGAVKVASGGHTQLAGIAAAAGSLAAVEPISQFDEQLLDSILSLLAADTAAIITRHEAFHLRVRSARTPQGLTCIPAQLVYQALDEHAALAAPWVQIPGTEDIPDAPAGGAFLCVPIGPPKARTCVVCLRTSRGGFSEDDVHATTALVQLAEPIKAIWRRLDAVDRLRAAEAEGRRPEMMLSDDSPASRSLRKLIWKIAPLNTPVLIRGEPGVGKEMVARDIHGASGRGHGPFVVVDCRCPGSLLDVTLWGAEPGTFTGSRPRGSAELANGGTLFVDALDAMPLVVQGKFLRLLQEQEIQRVGGTSAISVDVRVIAATAADLSHGVREGTFQEDLYYRLNVVTLEIPPLRSRRTEIGRLADQLLGRWQRDRPLGISEAAIRCLTDYDWPGNMREIEQVIARAAMVAFKDQIEPEDLPEAMREDPNHLAGWAQAGSLHRAVLEAKVQAVTDAWRTAGGAHAEAARALGITEGYFRRLVRQFGLDEQPPLTGVRSRK